MEQYLSSTFGSLIRLVSSKKFFLIILGLFIVQGLFFSLVVNTADLRPSWQTNTKVSGVAPDEHRHYNNIKFYAQRNIFQGPVIQKSEMKNENFFHLGEATRFPSYFYYYLMSFPAKVLYKIGASDLTVYLALRFVSIVFGVLVLYIIRKILFELQATTLVANLTLLATVSTQSFVLIGSAINYDMPALALFLAIALVCLQSLRTQRLSPLLFTVPLLLFLSIVKYTYIPFAVIAIAASLGYVGYKNRRDLFKKLITDVRRFTRHHTVLASLLLVVTALGGILCVERIGYNLIQYHSINPVCDKIFSASDCQEFSIYSRNERLISAREAAESSGETYIYKAFSSVGVWLHNYTQSTYVYSGHLPAPASLLMNLNFLVLALFIIGCLALKKRGILSNQQQWYIMLFALFYCVCVYVFNERSYYLLGSHKANQGRYILFSLIFFYFWFALLVQSTLRSYSGRVRDRMKAVSLTVVILTFLILNPLSTFLVTINIHPGEDRDWLREPYQSIIDSNR